MDLKRILLQKRYKAVLVVVAVCVAAITAFVVLHKSATTVEAPKDCESLTGGAQMQCFVDEVMHLATSIGITPALAKIESLLESYPELQNECHSIMHAIGAEAYVLYTDGIALDITPDIIMCTYGFYHGFINTVVLTEGSFDGAEAFCAYVNKELEKQGIDAQSECYHGFGHAVVDDHISTQFLNAHEVTDQALLLCDDLSESSLQYRNCASGVYNAIANIFADGTFEWPEIEQQHETHFCTSQPEDIKDTCYGYFARVTLSDHEDLASSLLFAEATVDEPFEKGVIENLAVMYMITQSNKQAFIPEIESCRSLQTYGDSCIAGLAVGVLQSAQTGEIYEAASDVCTYAGLTSSERSMCYERLLLNTSALVSKDEMGRICASVSEEYRTEVCF